MLRPVYRGIEVPGWLCEPGGVSLSGSQDTETVDEARRLWKAVQRENVMIKIPGTTEGIPAIRQAISEGVNINVTLLFAQDVYEQVADAYRRTGGAGRTGWQSEEDGRRGQLLHQPHRYIDRQHDRRETQEAARYQAAGPVEELAGQGRHRERKTHVSGLPADFQRPTGGVRSQPRGHRHNVCCGQTSSTKNPNYRDVIYVEELIGRDTVNTMPPATIDAFRDHGKLPESSDGKSADAEKNDGRSGESRHFDETGHGQTDR